MIAWHSLPYKPGADLVVGTLLSAGYVEGCGKRFAVYECRTREWDESDKRYYPSIAYVVKDAETSSDEDIRAGKAPKTVFRSVDLDACVGWIENNSTRSR